MIPNLSKGQRALLEKTFLTPSHPASFSSAQKMRDALLSRKHASKRVKVPSLLQIKQWQLEQRSFTLHRPARKHYKMKKVVVGGVNIQLQGDLVDMQRWAAQNSGFRYILLVVDCFSRYAYSRPLKTKQGHLVAEALESILDEAEKRIDRKIKQIQVDEGTEFYNHHVKLLLEKRHVSLFSTKSPTKAQMVERLIRTLRTRQERFNTFGGKRAWVDSFPLLVKSYNKTSHSSLPRYMTPTDVTLKNESLVWNHLYGEELLNIPLNKLKRGPSRSNKKTTSVILKIGDPVRVSKRKRTFEKSYYQNFMDEIFYISHVSKSTKPPSYRISDVHGELLEGIFYRPELSPVRFNETTTKRSKGAVYAVEEILKEEIRSDGKKYLFVKWQGYPSTDNQWIRADQFTSIKKAA
jgi:transposase InsO family protein